MSIIIDHDGMDGKIEFDTEGYNWPVLRAYPRPGSHYVYLGYSAQDDLRALGKAILNAMEPEALVENQKDAEPEPIKDGDWVLVAEDSPYNEHYRGKVLQVIEAEWSGSPDFVLLRSEGGNRGAVRARWVTPASAPTPEQQYDVLALVAAVANLEDRVADLEATAKDDEIKVGDRVYVRSDQWNIRGCEAAYGTVIEISTRPTAATYGKYYVRRDRLDSPGIGIWALEVSRG